jgi:hypothetical protein
MIGHGVEVASRSKITVAPRPSKYNKHIDEIEPVANNYADLYAVKRGWPITPEGLESFISDDLNVPFCWEEGEDPECDFYARYDPYQRTIIFNSKYEWIPETRPDLYISYLSHEVGHVVLRHGEAFDLETKLLFEDEVKVQFLNHPAMQSKEMDEELLKRALRVSHTDPHLASVLRTQLVPERYEPQWMYDQAQHFAGGFIVPRQRIQDEIGDGKILRSWDGIHHLARRFGCSKSFMQVRLKKLGLIVVEGNHVRPNSETGRL